MADLASIRTKVRRLTRSVSESQLTTVELDQYVNDFILYDMPERLRTFNLRKQFTFYTEPYIDTYTTNTVDPTNLLYQFKQNNLTVHAPFYVAGYKVVFTQSREQFYNLWPQLTAQTSVAVGNGALFAFAGTLPTPPYARNSILFSSIDANNNGLKLYDDGIGNLFGNGAGTINYVTGAYVLMFAPATPPAAGQNIYAQVFPYTAARPTAILFFEDTFTMRPFPDKVYAVNFEVQQRPLALLALGALPELWELWEYISYGAARKVFQDRMDLESVQMIDPEFRERELFALRRTIVQQQDQRAATIFSGYGSNQYDYGFQGPRGTY